MVFCGGQKGQVQEEDKALPSTEPQAEEHKEDEHQDVQVSLEKQKDWGIKVDYAVMENIASRISLPGVLVMNQNDTAHISSFVAGKVTALTVDLGSKVRKGQALCTINSPEFAQAQADFMETRARLNLSQKDFERAQKLFEEKALEEKEFLRREAEYNKIATEYGARGSTLHSYGLTHTDIDALILKCDTIKDEEYKCEIANPNLSILSPLSGTVVFRDILLGEHVAPEKIVFTVSNLSTLWALLDAYEKDLPFINKNSSVFIESPLYPGRKFEGKITYISDLIDAQLRTVKIRVAIDNSEGLLKPNMYIQGIVENTHRHLQIPHESKVKAIITAGEEVGRPLFFAIVIIILVFLPIFTLTGTEGIMFRPMGFTIAFALAGSLIFALISIPPLAFYLMRKKSVPKQKPFLIRNIEKLYIPFFKSCQRHRKRVFLVTFIVFAIGMALLPFMGREYIPYLEEGTLHLRATFDPNISLTETIAMTTSIEKTLMNIPEITGILSRIGRGEVGNHAHLINDAEILIQIQPIQKWKRFKHKDELIEEIEHNLENFPGITLNMTQPIAHSLDELITGVKAQLAIKLYGEDFEILKDKATQIKDQLATITRASDVQVEQFTGQNNIQIVLDRSQIARYGVNIQDIQETIEAALGGITLGQVYEEQKRFDIFLRFGSAYRQSIEQIENLMIRLPNGGQVPLKQLSTTEEVLGASAISRERNKRFITIQANIRGRDIGRFVVEAQKKNRKHSDPAPRIFHVLGRPV